MSGLRGHLDLLASADDGRTFLRRQSFSEPIHISKPHHDTGWLVVNLASPTPGLLAGDRLDMRVEIETGARLLLTTPSASRIHAMKAGRAEVNQEFFVAAGAMLDWWPEYLIPQAGSRYRQRSVLRVASGGSLLWSESVAPGRVAAGEVLAFDELHIGTDLHLGAHHAARERYSLIRGDAMCEALRRRFATPYYASLIGASPLLDTAAGDFPDIADSLSSQCVWVGASRLTENAWVVKVVASGSVDLRRTIAAVRGHFYTAMKTTPASLRRVTGESDDGGFAVRSADNEK